MLTDRALAEEAHGAEGAGLVGFTGFPRGVGGDELRADGIELGGEADAGAKADGALVLPEGQPAFAGKQPEDRISKVFRLHRRPAFAEFIRSPEVTTVLTAAIGPDIDCFLSQFIFKNPGAWGQPWHQDSYYFPFVPGRPVVGLWLAVSAATLENGCLHVLPGSHLEPVHDHIPDRRPDANLDYVEIVDHDVAAALPVLMDPGDLLVFDSHLMHRSTDNESEDVRAAMVWHFAPAGTVDRSEELGTGGNLVNDWMP